MAWTETTREQYRRDELRYASDTRAGEWAQIAPFLPAPRRLGRPRERDLRTIVDAILYLLWTGCQWRALPHEFPPRSTVQGYFYRWRDDGTWQRISAALVARARHAQGRTLVPSPASSTARARQPPRAAARAGLTPASASRDASVTSLPIHKAFCSPSWCMRPTFKTRTAPCRCCVRCAKPSPACAMSSPTGSIAARSCRARSPIVAPGRSRSSSARPASKASSFCLGDGWSSVPSPGSAAAAVLPRTSRRPSPAPQPGCCWPICDCSPAASQVLECKSIISSQTLRSDPATAGRVSKDARRRCNTRASPKQKLRSGSRLCRCGGRLRHGPAPRSARRAGRCGR